METATTMQRRRRRSRRPRVGILLTILVILGLLISVPGAAAEEDYYKVLGVDRESTDKQIKRAFRKLSLKYHPDKNKGNEEAHEKYMALNTAYEALSDPEKKQMYDIHGEKGLEMLANDGRGGNDPFAGFFGRGQRVRKGRTFRLDFQVSLEDVYLGKMQSLSFQRKAVCDKCQVEKCPRCGGSGTISVTRSMGPGFNVQMQDRCPACHGGGFFFKSKKCGRTKCDNQLVGMRQKTLEFVIEEGMPNGHEVKFQRVGEQSSAGELPGDVIVRMNVRDHPKFKRNQNQHDLSITETITLEQALLGFTKKVRHLDGHEFELSSKSVIQPNEMRTVRDEGMPHHEFPSDKGELQVTYKVQLPTKLSKNAKKELGKYFAGHR